MNKQNNFIGLNSSLNSNQIALGKNPNISLNTSSFKGVAQESYFSSTAKSPMIGLKKT